MKNNQNSLYMHGAARNAFNNRIYGLSCALLSLRGVFGVSQLDAPVLKTLTYTAFALLAIKLISTRYRWKDAFVTAVLLVIAYLSYQITAIAAIANFLLYLLGAKGVDKRAALLDVWKADCIATGIVIFSSLIGVTKIQIESGWVLGFRNPNGTQIQISMLLIYYLAFHAKQLGLGDIVTVFALMVGSALLTQSRTSIVLALFTMVLLLFVKAPPIIQRRKKIKTEWIYLVIAAVMLIALAAYGSIPELNALDRLLSGRLTQAHWYLSKYPINLFGHEIVELSAGFDSWHYVLDCGYARLFIQYGLVFGSLFLYLHYKTVKQARKQDDLFALIVLMGEAVLMMMENKGLTVNGNMSLILLSDALFGLLDGIRINVKGKARVQMEGYRI